MIENMHNKVDFKFLSYSSPNYLNHAKNKTSYDIIALPSRAEIYPSTYYSYRASSISVSNILHQTRLIVTRQADEENDGLHIIKAMQPLFPLITLPPYIHDSVLERRVANLNCSHACRNNAGHHNVFLQ